MATPDDKTADIIVILGQSNADGRAPVTDAPPELTRFFAKPRPELQIYYKPATRKGCALDDGAFVSDGAWWTLGLEHDAIKRRTHQVTGDAQSSVATQTGKYFGPELGCAMEHAAQNPGRPLYIIKAAVGGAAIENDWGVQTNGPRSLWRWFRDHVYGPALEDLKAQGLKPHVRAVFWMQGETDTAPDLAPLYAARLQTLIDRLNTELGEKPEAIIIGGLSAAFNQAGGLAVKQAQQDIAASNPNTRLLPTDGSDGLPALSLREDNIHYTAEAMLTLGRGVFKLV